MSAPWLVLVASLIGLGGLLIYGAAQQSERAMRLCALLGALVVVATAVAAFALDARRERAATLDLARRWLQLAPELGLTISAPPLPAERGARQRWAEQTLRSPLQGRWRDWPVTIRWDARAEDEDVAGPRLHCSFGLALPSGQVAAARDQLGLNGTEPADPVPALAAALAAGWEVQVEAGALDLSRRTVGLGPGQLRLALQAGAEALARLRPVAAAKAAPPAPR